MSAPTHMTGPIGLKDLLDRLAKLDDNGAVYHFSVGKQSKGGLELELVAEYHDLPEIKIELVEDELGSEFKITESADVRPAQPFTVWCRQANDTGTTWIQSVEARDAEHAAKVGLRQCSLDWGMPEEPISVIGVAEGNVKIVEWNDL